MRIKILAVAGLATVLLTACGGGGDDSGAGKAASSGSSSSSSSGSASPAGNGEAAKSGEQVAGDAADALVNAGAVHLTGSGTSGGATQQVDLQIQGNDAAGSITLNGLPLQFIRTGGKNYAKASAAFWQQEGADAARAQRLDGVWVSVPSNLGNTFGQFALDSLADTLRKPTDATIDAQVTTDTVDGTAVVVVSQSDGSTLAVAATGTPFPLREVDTGAEAGTLTYSGFGSRQTIAAPPSPLDLSQVA